MVHEIIVYRIFDKATGLYKKEGESWGKRGKFYNRISDIKLSFIALAQARAESAKGDEAEALGLPLGLRRWQTVPGRREYWHDLRHNPGRRAELYALLPETWVVLKLQDGEWVEISTARDFWSYGRYER